MSTFLVVDIETLGEKPPAAVIELGWTSVEYGEEDPTAEVTRNVVRFGTMEGAELFGIPEGQSMCPSNRAVHHIHPESLRGRPVFDATEWGVGFDDVEYLVAHNSAFEASFLAAWTLPWICTYKCALRAWPDAPSHSNQSLKYWLDHEDRDDYYPPHRALPDAKVTARTLYRLLEEHPVETLLRWTEEPRLVTKLPFGKHKGALLAEAPIDYLRWVAGPGCDAADADLKFWCDRWIDKRSQS